MENKTFRLAKNTDFDAIWAIILYAKEILKQNGSQQWQDGYPFEDTIRNDISKNHGYVVEIDGEIVSYVAISEENEPTYTKIDGKWLNDDPYLVIHRIAMGENGKGKGLSLFISRKTEQIALEKGIYSIRADTNYDNLAMKHLFEKENYTYCGIIQVRDGKREAYQKVLRGN